MREILTEVEAWEAAGERVAIATVASVWGSAPRPLGSKMAISSSGRMAGSVSGGCVEGAVFEEAQQVLASGEPKLVSFGVTNDEAWAVGLSCGGRIEIWIEALAGEELDRELWRALVAEELVAVATVLKGPGRGRRRLIRPSGETVGTLGAGALDHAAGEAAGEAFRTFASRRVAVAADGEDAVVFVDVHPPRPLLVVVGAVHVAIALVRYARVLGLRTVVVDPRTAFATPERFAEADELITEWPEEALARLTLNEATCVALLSHDLKLDIPALRVVLRRPVRYVGALGSKKTHAKRAAALAEEGFGEAEIARIHNPIGLDLGGRRAEEIALAVLAEITAVRHGIDFRPPPAVAG